MCSKCGRHKEGSLGGMPLFEVHNSSIRNEDVSGYEEKFFLGRNEEGCCLIGETVFELLAGESRALEVEWIASAIGYSKIGSGILFLWIS